MRLSFALLPALMFATAPALAQDGPHVDALTALAAGDAATLVSNSAVIDALLAQNEKHAGLSQADIDALDQQWRAETAGGASPLIDEVMGREVSAYLASQQEASQGLFTEIFVMDNKGLNVGQSAVTSDYWQGDEAKFQDTFGKGADAVHISEVEFDESTQTFQSQLSLPIVHEGAVIGAATIGVNVDLLLQ